MMINSPTSWVHLGSILSRIKLEEKRRTKCEKESGEQKENFRSSISPKPNSSVFPIPGDFTVGSSRFSDCSFLTYKGREDFMYLSYLIVDLSGTRCPVVHTGLGKCCQTKVLLPHLCLYRCDPLHFTCQIGKIEDLLYVKDYYLPVFTTEKPENKTDAEWTILHRQVHTGLGKCCQTKVLLPHLCLYRCDPLHFTCQIGKMEDLLYVKDYYLPVFTTEKPENKTDAEWTILHRQVCGYIRQWVDDNVLNHICDETHARTLWNKLEQLYARKTGNNKLFLIKQMMRLKYDDGSPITDHLNAFQGIINQLADDVITMELAKGSILNEEMRRKSQGSSSQSDVLVTERRRRSQSRGPSNRVLNGATCHVATRKEYFSSYTPGDFGVVRMGNTGLSRIPGIGDICLKFDTGMELVLHNVKHVPDMRLNIISTGLLDEDGYHNSSGKQTRRAFKSRPSFRMENILDLVHSDVCGHMKTKTLGGCSYFVTFIDDHSRKNDKEHGADDVDAQEQPNLDEDVHPELP
nr:retrovirus-related Pol polyprotein from transposon TNT 1-94 [Tanacetum cinerariifolium]